MSALLTEMEAHRLMVFVGAAMKAARGEHLGNDWDGGDIQDAMEELGLLERVRVTEPCDPENCSCAEWDDFPQDCLRPTKLGRRCEEMVRGAAEPTP